MPLPIAAAAAGAAARGAGAAATRTGAAGARGASAQEAGWRLELAKNQAADQMQETAQEEPEDENAASQPAPAAAATDQAATLVLGEGSFMFLKVIYTDIFTTIGLGTVFLSWLLLFLYTLLVDAITLFGFRKPQGFMANFMDPADGAMIFMPKKMIDQLPDWLKSGPRLLVRVMVIYPIGFIVFQAYLALAALLVVVAYGIARPVDAALLIGKEFIKTLIPF